MWARYLGRRALILPINGIQRVWFYLTAYLPAGQRHQHLYYPTTLHDKRSVSQIICDAHPELEERFDRAFRSLGQGSANRPEP